MQTHEAQDATSTRVVSPGNNLNLPILHIPVPEDAFVNLEGFEVSDFLGRTRNQINRISYRYLHMLGDREFHKQGSLVQFTTLLNEFQDKIPIIYSMLRDSQYYSGALETLEGLAELYQLFQHDGTWVYDTIIKFLPNISQHIQHAEKHHIEGLLSLSRIAQTDGLNPSAREKIIELLHEKRPLYQEDAGFDLRSNCGIHCLKAILKYGNENQRADVEADLYTFFIKKFEHALQQEDKDLAYNIGLLFDAKNSTVIERRIGEKLLSTICERYELNPREILQWWDDAGSDYEQIDAEGKPRVIWEKQWTYKNNIEALIDLEKKRPKSAKVLRDEFGIRNFGRYPLEILMKQYDERNKQGRHGIVITAKSDYNGAFFNSAWVGTLSSELQQLQPPTFLRVVEVDSKRSLGRIYAHFDKRYGQAHKLSFGIYNGHGTAYSIRLNTKVKAEEGLIHIDDLANPLQLGHLRGYYINHNKRPTIILGSCSTGADKGIGEEMEKKALVSLFAPSKPTSIKEIHVKNIPDSEELDFTVEYKDNDALRIYEGTAGSNADLSELMTRERRKRRKKKTLHTQFFNAKNRIRKLFSNSSP